MAVNIREKLEEIPAWWLWPTLLAAVLYWNKAWVPGFFHDGYLYAALGKKAAELGQWLVPTMAPGIHDPFLEHPPFVFILEGAFFKIFGSGYTQARIFSGFWGVALVGTLTWFMGKNKSPMAGLVSGSFLAIMPYFIKKVRFPNIDIPLAFFIALSLIFFWLSWKRTGTKTLKYDLLAGLSFGAALLCKGPPAFVVPITVCLFAIVSLRKDVLFRKGPWISLIMGFLVFSLWPLSLSAIGRGDVFVGWVNHQLLRTLVKARGQQEFDLFVYIFHLLKYAGPFVLLLIWGMFAGKGRRDSLYTLFMALFVAVLVPFSLVKFKYSHYILPLYPALAVLAAWPVFVNFGHKLRSVTAGLKVLTVTTALVMAIFPIGANIRRDKELHDLLARVAILKDKPVQWTIVDEAYPFWAMADFVSYELHGTPRGITLSNLRSLVASKKAKGIYLVKMDQYKKMLADFGPSLDEVLKPIVGHPHRNLVALLDSPRAHQLLLP